jgi:sRNA-binding carbon storage regulator CsrA
MLVLSGKPGLTVCVKIKDDIHELTVLDVRPSDNSVALLVTQENAQESQRRRHRLRVNQALPVSGGIEFFLLQVVGERTRIGVTAPREASVYRRRVNALAKNEDAQGDEPNSGTAGSRVPRPPTPKPPVLNARSELPKHQDGESRGQME